MIRKHDPAASFFVRLDCNFHFAYINEGIFILKETV